MLKGYIVKLPMGMGKTRIVLAHILRGAPASIAGWNRRLLRTVILAPNDRVKRAWLRELTLLAANKNMVNTCDESSIRGKRTSGLESLLEDTGLCVPQFMTYRMAWNKRKPLKGGVRCHYLVIDEWHSLPQKIREECNKFVEECRQDVRCKIPSKWFIGGRNIEKKIYFVSATPVNPVLEQEREIEEDPYDEEDFRERVSSAIECAIDVVQAFLGKRAIKREGKFIDIIYSMGVREIDKYGKSKLRWQLPMEAYVRRNQYFDESDLMHIEYPAIKKFMEESLSQSVTHNKLISREYAFSVGLIRTRQYLRSGPHFVWISRKGSKQCCFGESYRVLHHPEDLRRKRLKASTWLYEKHTRIKRLINILIGEGIMSADKRGCWSLTQKKALIFCTHTGVALGLVKGLSEIMKSNYDHKKGGFSEIATNVHMSKDKVDDLQSDFNIHNKPPFILVATDALSESIDLHEECKLLLHYELPWSPLRLFQRIGRLTRLKTWGDRVVFNKNVRVGHIVIPGSVEEERVNRLIRRIKFLATQNLWPAGYKTSRIVLGLIGSGPSMHYNEYKERGI